MAWKIEAFQRKKRASSHLRRSVFGMESLLHKRCSFPGEQGSLAQRLSCAQSCFCWMSQPRSLRREPCAPGASGREPAAFVLAKPPRRCRVRAHLLTRVCLSGEKPDAPWADSSFSPGASVPRSSASHPAIHCGRQQSRARSSAL